MRKKNKTFVKMVFLLIGTLLFTYQMGKYFESLYLRYADYGGTRPIITDPTNGKEGNEDKNKSSEKIVARLDGFTVYLIQNGVFSVEGGAKSQAKLLELDGFKTFVFYEDNYRIVSGVFLEKEMALSKIEKQRELGFDNFLLEIFVPDLLVEASSEEEKKEINLILSKFVKSVYNAQSYFDSSKNKKAIDLSEISYTGEDSIVLSKLVLIEDFSKWQDSQDDEKANLFLGNLNKYLRNIQ